MMKHFITQSIPSVVSEPDYVGSNGGTRNPIKTFFFVLIVSIAVCGLAMNLLAGTLAPLAHVFWLVFHVLYISGLVYFFVQKWKQYTQGLEV